MKKITFILNNKKVNASDDETIWQVAKREGLLIPHLCHSDEIGYQPDGNCRACMVEIEGERTLAASCIRRPSDGMKVISNSNKASTARKAVF
jgi:formate dehydrogenase major subunit